MSTRVVVTYHKITLLEDYQIASNKTKPWTVPPTTVAVVMAICDDTNSARRNIGRSPSPDRRR